MKKKLIRAFTDAEGAVNLEQIVEIATALPEAIKKVPVDQLVKLMPAMQKIMAFAKEQGAMPEAADMADEDAEGEEKDMLDEDNDGEKDKANFADSTAFKDAVSSAVKGEMKIYTEVVNKARNFVDADYDFVGKTANAVMRDALATQSPDKFEDSELPVAFKLLRKANTDYSQFGDSKPDTGLLSRISETLGEK